MPITSMRNLASAILAILLHLNIFCISNQQLQEQKIQLEYRLSMLCEPSGFITEALDLLQAITNASSKEVKAFDVSLTGLYGDCEVFKDSLPPNRAKTFASLRAAKTPTQRELHPEEPNGSQCLMKQTDGVYHFVCDSHGEQSEAAPLKIVSLRQNRIAIEHGLPCQIRKRGLGFDEYVSQHRAPPPSILIARCMTEANKLNEREKRCLKLAQPDELWVPTEWHRQVFSESRVITNSTKIHVIPEIVDSSVFQHVYRSPTQQFTPSHPFTLLSVFKWEWRKGWDVLLLSYWKAFRGTSWQDKVVLQIKTFRPTLGFLKDVSLESGEQSLQKEVSLFAETIMGESLASLPRVELITDFLPTEKVQALYEEAHAFVLPTRGEGWGLPIVEAMSSGLPVVVTNHSGPTAYLTSENSYPIGIEGIDEGGFALPSVRDTIAALRDITEHYDVAIQKGNEAAHDMQTRFDSHHVGKLISSRLSALATALHTPK